MEQMMHSKSLNFLKNKKLLTEEELWCGTSPQEVGFTDFNYLCMSKKPVREIQLSFCSTFQNPSLTIRNMYIKHLHGMNSNHDYPYPLYRTFADNLGLTKTV